MKKMTLPLFLGGALFLGAAAADDDPFQAWCDMYAAQNLVFHAADRIYGPTLDLDEATHEKRKAWVNAAYARAERRLKERTGKTKEELTDQPGYPQWTNRCQLKDIIR